MRTVPERVYDAALSALTDTWAADDHADRDRVEEAALYLRGLALAVTDEVCAELGIPQRLPVRRQVEGVDTGDRV